MERFRLQRRRPSPLRLLPLLTLAGFALAGCSGTRFGDQLADSFSSPPPATSNPSATATASRPSGPAGAARPVSTPRPVASPAASPSTPASGTRSPGAPPAPPTLPAAAPAPYRLTIRLPLADPSAPAERVTQVLRAAGVPFEVETIERVSGSAASGDGPSVPRTPAPSPR